MEYYKTYKKYKRKYKTLLQVQGGSENNDGWVSIPWVGAGAVMDAFNQYWQPDDIDTEFQIIDPLLADNIRPLNIQDIEGFHRGRRRADRNSARVAQNGGLLATLRPDLIGCYAMWAIPDFDADDITPGFIVYNQRGGQMESIVIDYRSSASPVRDEVVGRGMDHTLQARISPTRSIPEQDVIRIEHTLREHLEKIGVIPQAVPVAELTDDGGGRHSNGVSLHL